VRAALLLSLGMVLIALGVAACGGGSGGSSIAGGGGSSSSTSNGSTSSSSCVATGGANTSSAPNMATVIVDGGPACAPGQVDILYVTVVLCAPGSTTNCQTIDHVQVDTQSYGLRVLSEALAPALAAALTPVPGSQSGQVLAECVQFADGYSWGPIKQGDMQIAGEQASGIEVQVIGDPAYQNVPSDCSATGGTQEDTVSSFGANGILGVGPFVPDCGPGCTSDGNGVYYSCPPSGACASPSVGVSLVQQVSNPVASFAQDDNGVIVQLPQLASGGQPTVTGQLVFGIDTESNNLMTAQTVLKADGFGYIVTTYPAGSANQLTQSLIDSGSNAYYFEDDTIPQCTTSGLKGFYCPPSELSLSATNRGQNGTQSTVTFNVGDAATMNGRNYAAFDDLAGSPVPSSSSSSSSASSSSASQGFDWGLPFFFGRNVYTAIACNQDGASCRSTSQGYGPYYAY